MTYLVTGSDKAKRIQRIYEQLENTPTDPAARIQSCMAKQSGIWMLFLPPSFPKRVFSYL